MAKFNVLQIIIVFKPALHAWHTHSYIVMLQCWRTESVDECGCSNYFNYKFSVFPKCNKSLCSLIFDNINILIKRVKHMISIIVNLIFAHFSCIKYVLYE